MIADTKPPHPVCKQKTKGFLQAQGCSKLAETVRPWQGGQTSAGR
jgi:hypothetical protein